jgi:hypothetical protein
MTNSDQPQISDILKRASESTPDAYAPPRHRAAMIQNVPAPDNVKRIAEWVTQLTWREAVTMASGIKARLEDRDVEQNDLTSAMVTWAEGMVQSNGNKS